MIGFEDYVEYDAIGLAALVRAGDVSALELLEAALTRTAEVNPRIGAINHIFAERARAAVAVGLPSGPFHGVPFALKDLYMAYAGEPTTNGSRFWRDFTPGQSSELIRRYERAGFAIFAKTATPELGFSVSTESDLHGPTRNPWDLTRTTGGSSGGASAAVAAGILPLAHASDSGGSIRIPASCCGLFGLKPTRGRMPMGPERGESSAGLGTAHAVSRSVRDSAALLDASAGPDIGAPYGIKLPSRPWALEVGADPGSQRIALVMNFPGGEAPHPDCAAAVLDAACLCENLGHRIETAEIPLDYAAIRDAAPVISASLVAMLIDGRAQALGREPRDDELEPVTRALRRRARDLSSVDYLRAVSVFHKAGRDLAAFQQTYPLILGPTLAQPPLALGALSMQNPNLENYATATRTFAPMASLANITGVPAMTVPTFWNEAGLPLGVHFTARFGDEALLFRIAAQFESARPWWNRRPTL